MEREVEVDPEGFWEDMKSYNSFKTSLGDRTLTGDNLFNVLSPEKIGQFNHSSISSYRLAKDSLISSDNSTAFSSLNSLLDTILFNRASLSNFSLINLLTANDQSVSETCSTSRFKSSGITTFNSAISITHNNVGHDYLNNFGLMENSTRNFVFFNKLLKNISFFGQAFFSKVVLEERIK